MKIEKIIIELFKNPEIIQNYRNLIKCYQDKEMKEKLEKILNKRINESSND